MANLNARAKQRPFLELALIWVVALLAACAARGESLPSASAAGGGTITLELTLPDDLSLDSAGYTITGPGAYHKSARISVAATGATFDGAIGGIPPGKGYSIQLDAIGNDGVTSCAGSAKFAVSADVATVVSLTLKCLGHAAGREDAGSVLADGSSDLPGAGDAGPAGAPDPGSDDPGDSDPDSQAVAYQIDAAHSGAQPRDTLRLPLLPRWTHDFGAAGVSYPLVALGRVFVTVANKQEYGASLYALDSQSGAVSWGPVPLGGSYFRCGAAYEDGTVFALNGTGLLTAFDAATGDQRWIKQLPGQSAFSSAPTAFGGRVYVGGAGSGGTVYAVAAKTGASVWTAAVENGDQSSPAVSPSGVFVSYACNQAYGFVPATGAALWHHAGSCEGGGGKTVALIDDRIYTRDFSANLVLAANSGTLLGMFASRVIPAGGSGVLYTLTDGKLSARTAGSATPRWTFGDGTLTTAPIVVGAYVVVGSSSGVVSVVSVADGSLASSHMLPMAIALPDEQNVSGPLTGLAAAGNQLYVPAGTSLTAY
jgi:outer membrane protein assembly factor BamB